MKVLIIEDAEIDRLNLRTMLEDDHPDVIIAGEAATLNAAVEMINQEKPDAVFLDIHLGRQKGFRVLEAAKYLPLVVITTSHPHYALKGFEVGAVDYLLKPVMDDALARAVARLRERLASLDQAGRGRLSLDDMQAFRVGDDRHLLVVSSIQAILGERVYTRVLVRDGREFLHSRPLREWREMLPERVFKSLDRSTIVNMAEIQLLRDAVDRPGKLVVFRESPHRVSLGMVAVRRLRELMPGG